MVVPGSSFAGIVAKWLAHRRDGLLSATVRKTTDDTESGYGSAETGDTYHDRREKSTSSSNSSLLLSFDDLERNDGHEQLDRTHSSNGIAVACAYAAWLLYCVYTYALEMYLSMSSNENGSARSEDAIEASQSLSSLSSWDSSRHYLATSFVAENCRSNDALVSLTYCPVLISDYDRYYEAAARVCLYVASFCFGVHFLIDYKLLGRGSRCLEIRRCHYIVATLAVFLYAAIVCAQNWRLLTERENDALMSCVRRRIDAATMPLSHDRNGTVASIRTRDSIVGDFDIVRNLTAVRDTADGITVERLLDSYNWLYGHLVRFYSARRLAFAQQWVYSLSAILFLLMAYTVHSLTEATNLIDRSSTRIDVAVVHMLRHCIWCWFARSYTIRLSCLILPVLVLACRIVSLMESAIHDSPTRRCPRATDSYYHVRSLDIAASEEPTVANYSKYVKLSNRDDVV